MKPPHATVPTRFRVRRSLSRLDTTLRLLTLPRGNRRSLDHFFSAAPKRRSGTTTWESSFLPRNDMPRRPLSFMPPPEGILRSRRLIAGHDRQNISPHSKGHHHMLAAETKSSLDHPRAPDTLEESGLSLDLLLQVSLKTLHLAGELTGSALAQRLGVRFQVVEPALNMLKIERHCEIVGGSMLGSTAYRYRITDAGRVRAAMFLHQNHYVGKA